jgi:polar amino acid transport system substrate-binding protein
MNAEPESVSAVFSGKASATNPNAVIQIAYPNGSIGQVTYTVFGHRHQGKEYYEAFGGGKSAQMTDFRGLSLCGRTLKTPWSARQNKGQLGMLRAFAQAIRGEPTDNTGADAQAGLMATWMAIAAVDSAQGSPVSLPTRCRNAA